MQNPPILNKEAMNTESVKRANIVFLSVEKSTQFAAVCEGTKPNIYLSLSKAYHRHMKIK
jgi:hypothetical protein